MPQLFPPEIIENTVECYHARISTRSKAITYSVPYTFSDGRNITLHSYFANTKSQATGFELW
jgi:hypothetical protein